MSCYVNTVKGPVSPGELGITLMHEHLAEPVSYTHLDHQRRLDRPRMERGDRSL